MPVIAIFSASHCHADEVTRQVTARLGPNVLTDERLLQEASARYSVSADKLGRAMHGPRSFFHRWTRQREKNISYIRAAFADLLAEEGICSALWADWWGFKLESFDGISENVALVDKAGACAIVHSDSAVGIQRLNQEAAKAMAAARRQGRDRRQRSADR